MKRILIILLALILTLSIVGCSNEDSAGNQNNDSNTIDGGGTEQESTQAPSGEIIEITNENELFAMANDLTATYVLKNDITLTKTWKTLGSANTPFVGTLDGGGFTIYNMSVSSDIVSVDDTSIEYMVGMFGVLSGTVKDLKIDSLTISVNASSIAATNYQSLLTSNSGVTDLDIHVGLAGLNKGNIRNVSANINYVVTPECDIARVRTGGIAGKSNDEITNCTVSGDIRVQNMDGYVRAGGIAGYVSSNGVISGARANINLTAEITGEAKMNLGGLIGNIECGSITNCVATGSVKGMNTDGKATLAGGLIGLVDNTATKYENMSVTVSNSYSTAAVSASGAKGYAAGFIGQVDFGAAVTVSENACSGAASGTKGSFGFIGRIHDAAGTQLYSSSFTDGIYNDTVKIQDNQSVVADVFATKVSEITLPN